MYGFAFRLVEACTRTRFWSEYRQMLALDRQPPPARALVQAERLALLLQHAPVAVPYWRDAFAAARLDPAKITPASALASLQQLPITTKDDYKTGFPQRVTSAGNRDEWRFFSSAGTVDRLTVVSDFEKRDRLRAVVLRTMHHVAGRAAGIVSAEIPPHACNVVCGLADDGPAELGSFLWWALRTRRLWKAELRSELRGRLERRFLARRTTLFPIEPQPWEQRIPALDERLDAMAAVNPEVIRGLPLFLLWLARRAAQRGLRFPRLRAVLPYGALTSAALAARIAEGFGAPFIDVYGTGEVGEIGVQTGTGPGISLYDDLFVVEIVDDQGHPQPLGTAGRVILTDLVNRAMPLIRFQIGDWGTLLPGAGGDDPPRLLLGGRMQEKLQAADGSVVDTRALQDLFFADPAVLNFRVEETAPGRFTAKVVHDGPFQSEKLAHDLGALLQTTATPRVRPAALLRPEGSGKFRFAVPLRTHAGAYP